MTDPNTSQAVSGTAPGPSADAHRTPHTAGTTGGYGRVSPWVVTLVLTAGLAWCYWPTLLSLAREWDASDDYSVGALVPFAVAYLLWTDRHRLRTCRLLPAWGLGTATILIGQAVRVFGLIGLFESLERYSLVVTLTGVVILVAGTRMAGRVGWLLLFLCLMIPLPGMVHNQIALPLQSVATKGALVVLELIGLDVFAERHVLVLNGEVEIAVGEACSGLRMLTAFIVVAGFTAYLVDRARWQRAVLLLSSLPVAILCNLVRLVVTALLFLWVGSKVGQKFFHDFAGLTMMPLAVGLLLAELWLLSKLVTEDDRARA